MIVCFNIAILLTRVGGLFAVDITMDTYRQHLGPLVSRARICTAWAVLLKDYLGTSTVVFCVQDASLSQDSQTVMSDMAPAQTIGELLRQMEHELEMQSTCQTRREIYHAPSLSTQVCILDAGSKEEDHLGGCGGFDVITRCLLDNVGVSVRIEAPAWTATQTARMQSQFEHTFRQLCIPGCEKNSIGVIGTATPQDFYDIWTWNAIVPAPVVSTVWESFSRQVSQTPDALAVDSWDGALTYRELYHVAAKLADDLAVRGVARGMAVPCFFEKSLWASVAVLAVARTGAAFALMDENLPHDRLLHCIEGMARLHDGGVSVLLSSYAQEHRAKAITSYDVVPVGHRLGGETGMLPMGEIEALALPSDPAYVVFTSGTTGRPKPVVIRQDNLCTLAAIHAPVYGITKHSRVLDYASYAFDVSISNMFLSLLSGACLCIPSAWERDHETSGLINKYKISYAEMTPSLSRVLVPSQIQAGFEVLNLGGEACGDADLARWTGTPVRVMNTYGPAECTITTVVNSNALPCAAGGAAAGVSIGKGLGAVTWVVDPDDHGRLSPIGSVGELVLEGPLVGDGYCSDEAATDAKFKHTPPWLVSGCPGATSGRLGRLYLTGDLVRYLDDGSLEYVGRRDSQVKLRGQRIELAEVTMYAQRYMPSLASCCADVVAFGNGARLLVVFVQSNSGDGAELREMLKRADAQMRASLPAYMVPGGYVAVDRIPLTLSGKVDYSGLKRIALEMEPEKLLVVDTNLVDQHESGNQAPITEELQTPGDIESKLRHLWSEVLNVDAAAIRPSDTFFGHGGESLAAIKLVNRAAQESLVLSIATIFRSPRFSEMASSCQYADSVHSTQVPERFSLLGPDVDAERVAEEARSTCQLKADNIDDAYPCTPMQVGLIVAGYQRAAAYVGSQRLRLPEHVDPSRFTDAWDVVARNHPILRTRIVDTQPWGLVQVVLKEEPDRLLPDTHGTAALGLGTPLCRWNITVDPDSSHSHFTLVMHHAIYDGWTLPLLGAEVFRVYQGIPPSPSPPFNLFIHHLHSLFPSPEATTFWQSQLSSPHSTSTFPPVPTSIPSHSIAADASITKLIHSHQSTTATTDRSVHVSTPSLVRAAFGLLFCKLLGTDDITIGATVSGRNAPVPGIQDMLAPTISTVPVRVKMMADRDETVGGYVQRVQEEAVEMMRFEGFGLQNIRRCSSSLDVQQQGRSLFETLLVVQPPPGDADEDEDKRPSPTSTELRGLLTEMDVSKVLSNFNSFALMILVTPQRERDGGGLLVEASFDSKVIEPAAMGRVLDQFEFVLRQLGDDTQQQRRLAEVGLVGEEELQTIWEWNGRVPIGVENCVHDSIEKVVRWRPNKQAICAWDGDLSYGELDALSSRLAGVLMRRGITGLVPICMEKSKWAAVAMLGILKAGAAFVAMDVRHQPKQRLRTILEQVGVVGCIITAGSARQLAQDLANGAVIVTCEDLLLPSDDHGDEDGNQTGRTKTRCSPSDTAFIVFTSGSTGIPKGIIMTHSNLCTDVASYAGSLRLNAASRVYDYASYSFDMAAHNALATFMVGGCLCVPSEDDRQNDIEGSIQRLRANWADITPSVARLVDPQAVPGLEVLVLSGEAIGKDLIQTWAGRNVINAYGPAECQVCVVQTGVTAEDPSRIGRGVGCVTWVLDPAGDGLVPIGAVGELAIEGPVVSPGYLDGKASEHKSWLHNPVWLREGTDATLGREGSMYRTGDLVRYAADGGLVYMGRSTAQVKVNGQRVELGEVEYHLRRCPLSSRNAVVDFVKAGGTSMLVAFLVPDQLANGQPAQGGTAKSDLAMRVMATPDCSPLISYLKDCLPAAMVPSVFIETPHLPLTPTRKVDRKSLRSCAATTLSEENLQRVSDSYGASQEEQDNDGLDEPHRKMRDIWSQVLSIDPSHVHRQSDFFALRGDSISAMRLVKRGRESSLAFTVADVLRHPKLEDLVAIALQNALLATQPGSSSFISPFSLIGSQDRADALRVSAAAVCCVSADAIEDMYPCTPLQEGLFSLTASDPSAYVQHMELGMAADVSLDRVMAAWDAVVASTCILRTRLVQLAADTTTTTPSLVQVVIKEQPRWTWYDSLDEYLQDMSREGFGLGNPLCKFGLIRQPRQPSTTKNNHQMMVWTIHHAVYDSWTLTAILDHVSAIYHQDDPNLSASRTNLGPQYSIFVQHILSQHTESQKFWTTTLAGAHDAAIFPRPTATTTTVSKTKKIAHSRFPLLRPLPPGCTPATLFRAAWALVTARHTGCESVVFGETRLGRQHDAIPGIEALRGPTLATVPVLVRVPRDDDDDDSNTGTLGAFLQGVAQASVEMQPFEQMGLQSIARSCGEGARVAAGFGTLMVVQQREEKKEGQDREEGAGGRELFEVGWGRDDTRNYSSYPLMLVLTQNGDWVEMEVVYCEDALEEGLVGFLMEQMGALSQRLCVTPSDALLRDLDRADANDVERIWQCNRTVPEVVDRFIDDMFSEQVALVPETLAIHAHDGKLTYRQLDQRSSRLAAALRTRGVGLNCFVPLCFEKSVWVAVCQMALLKVGAAFALLDVSHPPERLAHIVEALDAPIVLASPSQTLLAESLKRPVITVGDNSPLSSGWDKEAVVVGWTTNNHLPRDTNRALCISYSSGTTGLPKMVVYSHQNIASALTAQVSFAAITAGTRIFDFSTYGFDATLWSTLAALTTGACLCTARESETLDHLAETMAAYETEFVLLVPSLARTISPADVPTLKTVMLGGEAVTLLDVATWKDHVRLLNAYGPTECTPVSLMARLRDPGLSIIGTTQSAGANAWVVDPEDANELVGIGIIGELVVEGPGVSRGYYNEPEKTAAAFLTNPGFLVRGSTTEPGRQGRLYRTGDLVRWRHDGTIEYIGRADDAQAKLRGQRLDFGGIAYQLKGALPEAGAIAVDIIAHPTSNRQVLVAFCEMDAATIADRSPAMSKQLATKLPRYMRPEAFLALDQLPLTKTGKLDRKRLRSMGPELLHNSVAAAAAAATAEGGYVQGLLTETETLLRSFWATVLGHDMDGGMPTDDFYQMGGDSITAMKLSALAREHDVELSVKAIIMNPQLGDMALCVKDLRGVNSESGGGTLAPFSLLGLSDVSQVISVAAQMANVSTDCIVDMYPCTPLQLELFSITLSQPAAYVRRCVFEAPEHIDFDRLLRAWDIVIRRNAILRSRFVQMDGLGLIQLVTRDFQWEAADSLQAFLDGDVGDARIDFGKPLSRLVMIRQEKKNMIAWTVHHALYDEWSIHAIEQQLRRAYYDQAIPASPGFNAVVQHIISQSEEEGARFWTSRLAGAAESAVRYPPLPKTTYRARPTSTFAQTLSAKAAPGFNFQAVMHAAWALVVSGTTEGASDVVFGATLTGRDADIRGIERIVGPTLTTVPIRVRVDKSQTVAELLNGIEHNTSSMGSYGHMGINKIGSISHDTKAASQFHTLMTVLPPSESKTEKDDEGIRVASYEVGMPSSSGTTANGSFYSFPLVLFLAPTTTDTIELEAIFDPAVLDLREVQRLASRLEHVTNQLARKDALLGSIQCLGEEDLQEIWTWNAEVPAATERCLHEVVLSGGLGWTTRVAVDAWDCRMTFGELSEMAERVCEQLRGQYGVQPGFIVPVLANKSGYVPAAVLGVLKAGGAFLPLDANLPAARLQAIMDQVSSQVVVTLAASDLEDIARGFGKAVLLFDTITMAAGKGNDGDGDPDDVTPPATPTPTPTPDDIACMLFTSGTTGTPKGVLLSHRALSSSVMLQTTPAGYHRGTRAFDFASYAFDVSWDTIFKVFSAGGCLCIPSEHERKNDLARSMNRFGANYVNLTPSVARLLDPTQLPALKTMHLAGESVDLREFDHWRPAVRVIISYGPSECTSSATFNLGDNSGALAVDGIGKGVGSVIWIVDAEDHTRLAPIGAAGELLIEGPLCGAGYHDNPVLTRASYVSDLPWLRLGAAGRQGRGSTLYKTGDLVRYDSRGYIHYLSRKDTQVKIRGQRVELREVEHHIKEAMGDRVRFVAANLVATGTTSNKILAAFLGIGDSSDTKSNNYNCHVIDPAPDTLSELTTVSTHLQNTLPPYMVPSAYIFLSSLPHSHNGKIDRKRLAELALQARPEQIHRGGIITPTATTTDHEACRASAPSTPSELKLSRLWKTSLPSTPPGSVITTASNFFDLGGDSISAMRLVSLARADGWGFLTVLDVFGSPDLGELAKMMDVRHGGDTSVQLGAGADGVAGRGAFRPFELLVGARGLGSGEAERVREEAMAKCSATTYGNGVGGGDGDGSLVCEDAYPATPLQENMMAATLKKAGDFVSVNVYGIPDWIDGERLRDAWARVVSRNPILRTRLVDLVGFGLVQVVVSGGCEFEWETHPTARAFLDAERQKTMGLGLRLSRWAVIESDGGRRKLVWTIHHALYDGWMLPMIEDQVRKGYLGQPPPEITDMRPFVHYMLSEDKAQAREYWARELAGAEGSMLFPALPHSEYVPLADCTLDMTLPFSGGSRAGATPAVLLYASWALLISHLTATDDVTFGAILSGRNAPVTGIDRMMGPTITTVPIRVRRDLSQTAATFVAGIQRKMTDMMAHEHLGIPEIRRVDTTGNVACDFQTVIVIQPPSLQEERPGEEQFMVEVDEFGGVVVPDQMVALNQYALMLEVTPVGSSLNIRASYDSSVLATARMERIIAQWGHILQQLLGALTTKQTPLSTMPLTTTTKPPTISTSSTGTTVGNLPYLSPQDSDTIWQRNHRLPVTISSRVDDMITAVASRHPYALCLDAWDGQLTYGELDRLSSVLAQSTLAGFAGRFVPLLFEKSLWACVAMLSVLKAGAAFVPLDAEHPEGKLRAVMQNLDVGTGSVLFCSARTRDLAVRLVGNAGSAVVVDGSIGVGTKGGNEGGHANGVRSPRPRLNGADPSRAHINGDDTGSTASVNRGINNKQPLESDLAYVVFTSGSSNGIPKGVRITHSNLASALHHQPKALGFQSATRSLDSSSYSFDACIFNLFYTLVQGGCLCIPDNSTRKGNLGAFMREYKVNLAQLTPSVARSLDPESLPDLQSLILTGEPLMQGDIATWAHRVRLVNVYGPTECTIMCSATLQVVSGEQACNIGQGLGANLWLTELGNPSRLCAVGGVGEILIEGPLVGAGYVCPPQTRESASRVIDPPWLVAGTAKHPGRRGTLFRTGDMARYADDGTIVYIGRIGSEVKLRGQRVDLAEVEDVLRRLVRQDMELAAEVVSMRWGPEKDEMPRQMLLAFVSPALGQEAITTDNIKEQLLELAPSIDVGLGQALAAYLQPEAFVVLPQMPKTSSQKADRVGLRAIGARLVPSQLIWLRGNEQEVSLTPPATQMEQTLSSLWAEILRVDVASISHQHSFFRLGGDSIGVMRLTTLAHKHGLLITANNVFKSPHLEQLALTIRPLVNTTNGADAYKPYSLIPDGVDLAVLVNDSLLPVLAIAPSEIIDILPANQFQADCMVSTKERFGLQYAYLDLSPTTSWPKLVSAVRTAIQSFECLRSRFILHNHTYYQIILATPSLTIREITIANTQDLTTFSNTFCLSNAHHASLSDPFTELTLATSADGRRRVIFRLSHAQHDGWCVEHIFRALETAYSGGLVAPTPPFSAVLHHRSVVAEEAGRYWRELLVGSKKTTGPVVYKPARGGSGGGGGGGVRTLRTVSMPGFVGRDDGGLMRPAVLVNVAWALVLMRLTGERDLVFGNVTTGRGGNMAGLEDVVGPCVCMVPLRMNLGSVDLGTLLDGSDGSGLLKLVEESARQIDDRLPYEGLDWDQLVRRCTEWPEGDNSRYRSSVHFRNMNFSPELSLSATTDAGKDGQQNEGTGIVVGWNELVATPDWTTVLAYPEDGALRLWLNADPSEIGDEGADEILGMIVDYMTAIVNCHK